MDTLSRQALPLNFPQSFLPERSLLAKIFAFAAQNGAGNKLEIMQQTGIPTGESTGKVEPMIGYAQGMGLIQASQHKGHWQLGLTPLGQSIFQEDRYLHESQTQWLLHLLLCRRLDLSVPATGLADAWFAIFAESHYRLGKCFKIEELLHFVSERHQQPKYVPDLVRLVVRSYQQASCFKAVGAIREVEQAEHLLLERGSAPTDTSYFPFYAAFLYLVWDDLFAGESQLALEQLAAESRCFLLLGWTDSAINRWLYWLGDQGWLQLDRHTGTPVLLRLRTTGQLLEKLYSEML